MSNQISQAKELLKNKLYGILSTQSKSLEGYPFGSLVQYCVSNNGKIIFYLSAIAQHTKNILHNEKASLMVTDINWNGARI